MSHDNNHPTEPSSLEKHATTNAPPTSLGERLLLVAVAVLLSLLWAGAGQAFNRQWWKALAFAVLAFLLWFLLLGWVVVIVAAIDAGVVAWRCSSGEAGG
jgi:chromate transport protein ChrA